MIRVWAPIWLALATLVLGCRDRPEITAGGQCELTTECAAPLVCRFDHCRSQCATTRDCQGGSFCVNDTDGSGFCLLGPETMCLHPSDCVAPLVCSFGRCTNACEMDRDCPTGARCRDDGAGALACLDVATQECRLGSDCPRPLVCAVDYRCREQCVMPRDCGDGMQCVLRGDYHVCELPDAGAIDAGTVGDSGSPEAGTPADGGAADGG